ncbi:hypothetical protein C8Q76DRAFT_759815 [Earliella scabrosa]|nr:hypothetical protein C8Q76DRAFT_759815 [Earliella scabrosa]
MSQLTDMNAYWTDVLSRPDLLGLNDLRTAGALLLNAVEQIEVKKTEIANDVHGMLGVLEQSLQRAMAVVRRLLNGTRPINRIPSEILLRILSLAQRKSPFMGEKISHMDKSTTHWPFPIPDIDDLRHLSQVCTRWREVALAAPALWSTFREINHRSSTLDSLYLTRCPSGPIDIYVDTSFSDELKQQLLQRGPQIRQFHMKVTGTNVVWAAPHRQVIATLATTDASALEHCSLLLPLPASVRLQRTPALSGHGTATRLRSLFLSVTAVLPQWELPALTRCVLTCPSFGNNIGDVIDTSSLLAFLSGTPQLEVMHLYRITVRQLYEPPPSHHRVPVSKLRYLCYNPRVLDMPYLTDFLAHLLMPSQCQLDIDSINLTQITISAFQSTIQVLVRGAFPPTKVGIHVNRAQPGTMQVSLELARGASPELSGCTRIKFEPTVNGASFWSALLTPQFCAEIEECRVNVTGERENETAEGLAAMWPLLVKVRKLSVAFRLRSSDYLGALRRALEPLCTPIDGSVMHPSLGTLDVYIDVGARDVIQYLADFLGARASRGGRVRRFVLGATEFGRDLAGPQEHVDEFVRLEFEDNPRSWMDWPLPRDRDNDSELVGANWPAWTSRLGGAVPRAGEGDLNGEW